MAGAKLWHTQHNTAFLAWFDFCLENDIDFNGTIENHLRQATGKHFSEYQIRNRVHRFIREDNEKCAGRSISILDFREKGSLSLLSLSTEYRKQVKTLVQKYTTEYLSDDGKNTTQESTTMLQPPISASQNSASLASQQGKTMGGIAPVSKKVNGADENTQTQESLSTPFPSKAQKRPPTDLESLHTPRSQARRADGMLSTEPPRATSSEVAAMQKIHEAEVRRLNAEINAVRTQWHQEAEEFAREDKRRKQIELKLQASIAHLEIARKDMQSAGKNPLEKLLFTKDEEIWYLKQKNHEMQRLAGFAQRIPKQRDSLSANDVPDAFQTIENELQSILHGHDVGTPLLQPSVLNGEDLALLIRTLFSESTDVECPAHQLLNGKLKWGTVAIVRGLAVAALQQWVFATDFPNLCRTGPSSQLLNAYRKTILAHDGWDSLHNLEIASYSSLLDVDTFKKGVVARRADQLAARLSKALAPLFKRSPDDQANAVFETWNQPPEVCEDRRFRFKGMFEAALNLKARTTLTDHQYEFVVHAPGTSVNKSNTSTCTVDSQVLHANGRDRESEQWLYASIYIYPGEPASPPDPMGDALVQPLNFVTNANKENKLQYLSKRDLTIQKQLEPIPEQSQGSMDVAEVMQPGRADEEILITTSGTVDATTRPHNTNKRSREKPRESTLLPSGAEARQRKRAKLLSHQQRPGTANLAEDDENHSNNNSAPAEKSSFQFSKRNNEFSNVRSRRIHMDNGELYPQRLSKQKNDKCHQNYALIVTLAASLCKEIWKPGSISESCRIAMKIHLMPNSTVALMLRQPTLLNQEHHFDEHVARSVDGDSRMTKDLEKRLKNDILCIPLRLRGVFSKHASTASSSKFPNTDILVMLAHAKSLWHVLGEIEIHKNSQVGASEAQLSEWTKVFGTFVASILPSTCEGII